MMKRIACAAAVLALAAGPALAQELPPSLAPLIGIEAPMPVAIAVDGRTNIAQSSVNTGDVSVRGRVTDSTVSIESAARVGALVSNSASVTISGIGAANSVTISNTTTSVRPASGR